MIAPLKVTREPVTGETVIKICDTWVAVRDDRTLNQVMELPMVDVIDQAKARKIRAARRKHRETTGLTVRHA